MGNVWYVFVVCDIVLNVQMLVENQYIFHMIACAHVQCLSVLVLLIFNLITRMKFEHATPRCY